MERSRSQDSSGRWLAGRLVDRSRRGLVKQLAERDEHLDGNGPGDQLVDGCKRTRVRKAKINTSGCP
jgi:hypothetical protein